MNDAQCWSFIKEFPFASITTTDPLQATHLPFQVGEGANGDRLIAHMARANNHWKSLDGKQALIIFTGPHHYVSGHDYVRKPAVPTWNYTAVHVTGKVSLYPKEINQEIAQKLLLEYEPDYADQQDVYEPSFIEKLTNAIVSFEVEIQEIQGKLKLGQHKGNADKQKLLNQITQSQSLDRQQMADFIQRWEL